MHDPMHVVAELRRPPLTPKEWRYSLTKRRRRSTDAPRRRHRQFGPLNIRAAEFACFRCDETGEVTKEKTWDVPFPRTLRWDDAGHEIFECPECAGRGFNRTPWRRRLYFGWAFWRFGEREVFFPGVIVLWHVDPEIKGDDKSCSRPYLREIREAKADGRILGERWATWKWRHYGLFHWRHWQLQVRPLQEIQRWLFDRCEGCGGRLKQPVISGCWEHPDREHFWTPRRNLWHDECYSARSRPPSPEPQEVAG